MLNYDFHNLLSAYEFECFSRDLINAHEKLNLGNFAEGKDGGIDLRCTYGEETVIVQVKRYMNYNELKSTLKKEVDKVRKLNPTRYLLTTSVDLTPDNKKEIAKLFHPYIKREEDIWAKQDLNKILEGYPNVERQYYKLWLSSTNVLNTILHKNIVNWTNFEKKEIENAVRTYVMNDSFNDALNKLIENRYVIISGEPGIGKTTLARVLVMHLLSQKFADKKDSTCYEDFQYTNYNIDDLAKMMQDNKRQIFLFDDFLGQIAFEKGEKNFDSRIIQFIKACQRNQNKLFILTTREYILQQGLAYYSRFNDGKGIELSKCIVDLGKYTRFVRAQILYNHLVANKIPQAYINSILESKNYLKIIDHRNFSPRIIETFISNGTHELCTPIEYFKKIIGFFDHPNSVWLDAFLRLSTIEQEALLVLSTMETPVLYNNWEIAYQHFFKKVHKEENYLSDSKWKSTVKVLQNNFIKTEKCPNGICVEFHNPGIKDVLIEYIKKDNIIRELLIDNIYYIDQLFGLFCDFYNADIPDRYHKIIVNAFDKCWKDFKCCDKVIYREFNNITTYSRFPMSKIRTLNRFIYRFNTVLNDNPNYVGEKVTQELMSDESFYMSEQLDLLGKIQITGSNLDMDLLFETYKERLYSSDDCLNFAKSIERLFPNHLNYLETDEFCDITEKYLREELEITNNSDLEELESTAKKLCDYLPSLKNKSVINLIEDANNEYYEYLDSKYESYQDDYRYEGYNHREKEDFEIDRLFATIKE
ncbi:MAG: AAA family ATPase [Paludibacteraceae bacterium]|nr:AAA family ATPase [Paludibacteraceae bacterium]